MQVGQIVMIRFGGVGWPIDHQPELLEFAPGLAQCVLQPNLTPREASRPALTTCRFANGRTAIEWQGCQQRSAPGFATAARRPPDADGPA